MSEYLKPLPYGDAETRPYWEWTKRHELRMQRCADCGELRFPPGPMCPACHSMRDEWVPMAGTATIYSWVIVHPPVLPAFQSEAPYSVVLVQLDDHPQIRLVGSVIDIAHHDLAAGIPVEVVFDDVTPDITLPKWRRRSPA